MELLEKRILKDGKVLNENVLKVDSFVNHQVDPKLMQEIGKDFAEHFKNRNITKVVTIETSGIAPAIMTAILLDVPMIILKKSVSNVLSNDIFQTPVKSFTKGISYDLILSKKYLDSNDNVLIIDDFLANGEASAAAIRLAKMAGANVEGIGIVIEKSFQVGRKKLEDLGIEVYSLARISKMSPDGIEFLH